MNFSVQIWREVRWKIPFYPEGDPVRVEYYGYFQDIAIPIRIEIRNPLSTTMRGMI